MQIGPVGAELSMRTDGRVERHVTVIVFFLQFSEGAYKWHPTAVAVSVVPVNVCH